MAVLPNPIYYAIPGFIALMIAEMMLQKNGRRLQMMCAMHRGGINYPICLSSPGGATMAAAKPAP
jgi:hypothetical protein